MEGKENYKNEDEEQNQDSNKQDQESDDFGLPDIENTENSSGDEQKKEEEYNSEDDSLGTPYSNSWEEEKKETGEPYSDPFSYNEDANSNPEQEYHYESEETGFGEENAGHEEEYHGSSYYEEDGKKGSPVGWIILIIIVLISVGIGIFWWFNRGTETPKPTYQAPKQTPVVTKPDTATQMVEKTPASTKPPKTTTTTESSGTEGMVSEISEPTGRYYVIIASFIDDDLAMDYAKKLTKEGITCKILDPRGNKKFFRFSIADFPTVNEAAIRAEQLKSTYGEGVWVMKY